MLPPAFENASLNRQRWCAANDREGAVTTRMINATTKPIRTRMGSSPFGRVQAGCHRNDVPSAGKPTETTRTVRVTCAPQRRRAVRLSARVADCRAGLRNLGRELRLVVSVSGPSIVADRLYGSASIAHSRLTDRTAFGPLAPFRRHADQQREDPHEPAWWRIRDRNRTGYGNAGRRLQLVEQVGHRRDRRRDRRWNRWRDRWWDRRRDRRINGRHVRRRNRRPEHRCLD